MFRRAKLHHRAKFRGDRSNPCCDMAIFQDGGRPAAILDFYHFKFLTVSRLKRVEMRFRAKFGWNRSNCCWDVALFRFFQHGGRPPSWICDAHGWTTHKGHLVVFSTVQNLVGIDTVALIICKFLFCNLGLKTPIHPKNCFFGDLSP